MTVLISKGGNYFMTYSERRFAIIEELNIYRHISLEDLSKNFKVSKKVIKQDVKVLSTIYPIFISHEDEDIIRVHELWFLGKIYLKEEEENLLRNIKQKLDVESQKKIDRILRVFAKPRIE